MLKTGSLVCKPQAPTSPESCSETPTRVSGAEAQGRLGALGPGKPLGGGAKWPHLTSALDGDSRRLPPSEGPVPLLMGALAAAPDLRGRGAESLAGSEVMRSGSAGQHWRFQPATSVGTQGPT